jgi:hypothetical protein
MQSASAKAIIGFPMGLVLRLKSDITLNVVFGDPVDP